MSIVLAVAVLALAPQQTAPQPRPSPPPQSASQTGDTTVGGVTVDGARAPVETSIDRRSYSVADDLNAQTGSIADVLRDIPSVQVDLQGNPSLRGDPNVTVLVDGKPASQFSGESLAQALQALPANQVEHIEVMTNPSAEFRADGSGGVINLIMKKARGAGKTASLRVQAATDNRATVTGNAGYNTDKLSTVADFSYRQDHQVPVTDNLQSRPNPATGVADDNEDFDRGHLAEQIVTGHVGSDYDLSAKTRLSGGVRASYIHADLPSIDRFEQDDDAGAPVGGFTRLTTQRATQYNGEASAVVRHTWEEGRDLVLTATYGAMQYKRPRSDLVVPIPPANPPPTDSFDRHTHNNTSTLMADYETPLPGKARLKLGYDFDQSDTVFEQGASGASVASVPSPTGSFLDAETRNQAYVTYERPFGKFDVLIGLRAEALRLALDQQTQNGPPTRTMTGSIRAFT